jgi:hypothetical protein
MGSSDRYIVPPDVVIVMSKAKKAEFHPRLTT